MSPRWKKILRDLWGNKLRTFLVVLSIAVGVFAVGAVTHTFSIVTQEMTVTYPKANPASATVYTDRFDDDLLQAVRRVPGVADVEARSTLYAQIRINDKEQKQFLIFAIPDFDDIRINKVRLQEFYAAAPDVGAERGVWPPPERAILLERSSFLMPGLVPAGLKLGDTIELDMGDDRIRRLKVAGLAHESTQAAAPWMSAAYGYVTMDTYEWLTGSRQLDTLNFTVSENQLDQDHIKKIGQTVKDKIEASGRTVYTVQVPQPGKHWAQDIFNGLLLLLNLLGFGSLFLSGFLVVNTISALLAQQVRQIGMMKAVGARNRQITLMYLVMVLLFGAMALALAMPAGAYAASELSQYLAGLVNVDFPDFSIPPHVIVLEVAIGLGLPLIAAFFPILSGTRVSVREAISDYGLGKGAVGAGRMDHLLEKVRGLSRPMILSFRNTFRRKGRLLLTLLTLILGGTIFISVLSVHASMLATLDDAFKYWQFDILVPFAHPYASELVESKAASIPGVVKVESWGYGNVRRLRADDSESETITLFAPPPDTKMLFPTVVEGRWLLPDDDNAIVISLDVSKAEKDIKVGDEIRLKISNHKTTWRVVGKVRTVGQFGAGIGTAYANYPYYARVIGQTGRADSIQILTADHTGPFQNDVKKKMEEIFKRDGIRVGGSITSSYLRESNEVLFNILTALLAVMAVLMAAVGGLGLMGTMSLNVLERTREIGVMRAIGASNGAIQRIVLAEGIFIGWLSGLIAVALSFPLGQLLSNLVGDVIFQVPLTYAFSTNGVVLWLVIVTILSTVASILPALNASRLTVRQVLAYE